MTRESLLNSSEELSLRKQSELLDVNRLKKYYERKELSESDFQFMNEIDKIYTEYPIYGYRRIWHSLMKKDIVIGRDRVLKYMQLMGIQGIAPRERTTLVRKNHKKYPYLLKNLKINRVNQVWSMDITYIKLEGGFCYLAAIIDWHSKYILSFKLSNTLSTDFCIEVLEEALDKFGKPEIFNTDQGCQFTSESFTKILLDNDIKISMDGKGRALDNIAIERFWRSLKYEDIYLNRYQSLREAKHGIQEYINFYNNERLHSAINYKAPVELHVSDFAIAKSDTS